MMRWWFVARAAMRSLFGRRAAGNQLDADLQFHLEQEIAEHVRQGLSPAAARRAAMSAFGNPTLVREEVLEMSMWTWWERLTQDLRYGVRGFRRSPVFAATAVLSLALGIGANAAIFTVIDAALWRPIPVSRPDQLVLISNPKIGDFSYPGYVALRDGARSFSDLIAASRPLPVNVGVGSESEPASAKIVSGNYFAGLGVRAAIGAAFTSIDEMAPVAVISRGYWLRRFGGAPSVVGRQVHLDGAPFTIVGVAPADFFGDAPGQSPDLWTSMALQPASQRNEGGFTWLSLIGRLKFGATLAQARGEVEALLARRYPTSSGDDVAFRAVEVSSGARGVGWFRNNFLDPLRVLMVIVGLVLVIACTNLGSLLVTRGAARQVEIATRLAIGASRARIVRQLMTESLLLAGVGGAIGLLFSVWGSRALLDVASSGIGIDLILDTGLDARVLVFTGLVSVAAGALFGLAPALRAVRRETRPSLVGSDRGVAGRTRRWSARDAFIVAQISLSLMLLAGSAMFIRTLRNLERQDLGFGLADRLQARIVRERGYRPVIATLVPALLERMAGLPGVVSASVAFNGTLADNGSGVNGLEIDGYTPRDAQDRRARADWVGPDYFRTVGIPLVTGRDFTLEDTATAPKVAIVNETMARQCFASGGAVGRRFTFNKNEYSIVGVAKDAKYTDLRAVAPRLIYFPVIQSGSGLNVLEIRTSMPDPISLVPAIRSTVREVDPHFTAAEVITLSQRLDRKLSREHLVANLTGLFSGLTLLLVSIGVYGTLAYTAARRTREIGIRLALGSSRGAVMWIVMRGIVTRLGVGLVLGGIGVLALGPLLRSLLFGLRPNDLATIGAAMGVLTAVALLAGSMPILRASRLDPASVLRE